VPSSLKLTLVNSNILGKLNTYDYFGFPANSVIVNDRLIMGAGSALAFRTKFRDLDALLAAEIQKTLQEHKFLFATVNYKLNDNIYKLFALQTKTHYQNKASMKLIVESLKHFAFFVKQNPDVKFHMPIPGIGCGGISKQEIIPILNQFLPRNVILYEYNSKASC
jgi:hypothetical protein